MKISEEQTHSPPPLLMNLILVLAIGFARGSQASTLHQSDLGSTIGFLKSEEPKVARMHPAHSQKPEPMPAIASDHFEEIQIATSPEVYRGWINGCLRSQSPTPHGELFYFEPDELLNAQQGHRKLEDESKSRLLTVWSDCGSESIKQAIVVWRDHGKDLTDEIVLDHAFVAAIGRTVLTEIHEAGKGRHVLIGRTTGGDGGESWESIWAASWTEPRHLEVLYTTDSRSNEDSGMKIDYHYDPKTLRLHFTRSSGKTASPANWKTERWDVDLKEKLGPS